MNSERRKPWNTPDFETRFREAMGREMTDKEREFFGIEEPEARDTKISDTEPNGNSARFAWQALRRISAIIG